MATTSQGNAYIMRHVVLSLQSGKHVGQELYQEIQTAFAEYLEYNVINYWEPDLLDFLLQICVVDEFTLELAELVSGNSHVLALLEKAAAIREKAASLEFAKNSSGRSLSGSRVGNTPRAPAISSLGSFSSPPALMGQDMMSRSLARHATE